MVAPCVEIPPEVVKALREDGWLLEEFKDDRERIGEAAARFLKWWASS